MADWRSIFSQEKSNPGYCLVLRPFHEEFDRVWGEVRVKLSGDFYWIDVKSLHAAGDIMPQVLSAIARTDVVIADVSEGNPNVFYELGIARFAKGDNKVILVKQKTSHAPFDVSSTRYLDYEPTSEGIRKMADELRVRINQAKEKTTWFLVPEGETHTHDPLPGRNGDYQFEVRAVLLTGGDPGPEAVTIDLTVRPYPASDTSPLDHSEVRLLNKKSCAIPNLPWRLKFEYFELNDKGSRAARICVIPGGKR